ncbi:N2227-domain-containing protein [Punctularia strigosozonata HHB-11173 SS5]|uniref:N2227-domain-containing protein n=1 Tax=Punctularia strigosozonata (strain HHB-11173) TaxID=741275 RepID=UPI00044175C7|nr:N2227-domain-containing protein [Punctularia strigosozonata HHB-11173 SS5]EIN14663.1 N2227-domain-containing protein [Punctularia strigosozonata HHB-11173 SS5]
MPPSQEDLLEEQIHFANIVETFKQYGPYALAANNKRRKDFFTLPRRDRDILEELGYRTKINEVDEAILKNAEFLSMIVADPEIFGSMDEDDVTDEEDLSIDVPDRADAQRHEPGHSHSHSHSHGTRSRRPRYRPTEFDMDKLRSTIKQFVRDWTTEGEVEREACYKPMTDALLAHFGDIPTEERRNFRVLVPGAGLGRLAWDVARLGFACQGNEFSHYMLLSSYFILNRTTSVDAHTIYPYVHSFSNVTDRASLLRSVSIPDVLPSALPEGSDFSLVAGDFEEVYGPDNPDESNEGKWDAILTCFFIDTAKNIVNYLRVMHHILAPGGIWINIGPLLWHWENNTTNDPSVELDLEEVKLLARKLGFKLANERTIKTTYTSDANSMLGYVYETAFWTATKEV